MPQLNPTAPPMHAYACMLAINSRFFDTPSDEALVRQIDNCCTAERGRTEALWPRHINPPAISPFNFC